MKLSQNGLDLIKSFEGLRLISYKALPSEQFFTIGYGHYGSDVKPNERITEKDAENMLLRDVANFEGGVNAYVKTKINQNQFDALVSFCYNVGLTAFYTSTMLSLINENQFEKASEEFPKWCHATINGKKEVVQGLVIRRQKERELFDKPVPETQVTYKVVSGDNLTKIANQFHTTVDSLVKLNNIENENLIYPNQILKIK